MVSMVWLNGLFMACLLLRYLARSWLSRNMPSINILVQIKQYIF